MPKVLKDAIDKERGDVPRSRFITKILQQEVTRKKEKGNENRDVGQRRNKCWSSANSGQVF